MQTAWGTCCCALLLVAPPALAQGPTLAVDGQVRLRGEWDGRTSATAADAATLSRIRLGVRVAADSALRVYLQLQDARAWGTESNTLTDASADQLDLHQGYVELGRPEGRFGARLGRQELSLGDERLVGPVGWTNTGRSFDGALVRMRDGRLEARAFWMVVAERDALIATGLDPQANEGADDDGWLVGAFASVPAGALTLEGTLLHDRNAVTDASWTAAVRAHGGQATWRLDGTAAYQFGRDRRAYLVSGRVGKEWPRLAASVQVDYLSGDGEPTDPTRRAFHTLYATNHKFYGFMDYFLALPAQTAEAGLLDAQLRLEVPTGPWRWRVDAHRFATAEPRAGSRALGTEIDLVGSRPVAKGAVLELGAAVFAPARLAGVLLPAFAAGTRSTYWGYAQLTVQWR